MRRQSEPLDQASVIPPFRKKAKGWGSLSLFGIGKNGPAPHNFVYNWNRGIPGFENRNLGHPAAPVDDQDRCYRQHDYCYSSARKNNMGGRKSSPGQDPPGPDAICDVKLSQCLHAIPWKQFNGHEFCSDILFPLHAIYEQGLDWGIY